MAGFPVMLLIALTGVTYGWKPDQNGGVEYTIQIPPDELQQLQRRGSVSSVIDPAVRGHVSRIVVQVGTEPLPQVTPPELALAAGSGRGQVVTASDEVAIPIPEIESIASTEVMKPQNNEPPGGFNLPDSLSQSGANSSNAGASDIDRAGRETSGTNSNGGNGDGPRHVVAPPATRTPSDRQLPPFTGDATSSQASMGSVYATPRSGGPSTDPVAGRDRDWTSGSETSNVASGPRMPGTSANELSRNNGPSTDPVGNQYSDSPFRQQGQQSPNTASATSNATSNPSDPRTAVGLGQSDSFGRIPGGYETAPAGAGSNSAAASSLYSQNQASQQQANSGGYSPNAEAAARSAGGTGQSPSSYAAPSTAQASPGGPTLGYPRGYPNPNLAAPPNASATAGAERTARPLTAAERAAGAWSVNIYGEPVDREGRPLVTYSGNGSSYANDAEMRRAELLALQARMQSAGEPASRTGSYSDLGRPSPSDAGTGAAPPSNNSTAGNGASASRRERGYDGYAASASDRSPSDHSAAEDGRREDRERMAADPPSLVRRSVDESATERPPVRQQASQPLLTWLLLISVVGNVYLVFWMKKLLVRYRDLVAAKRMAGANSNG